MWFPSLKYNSSPLYWIAYRADTKNSPAGNKNVVAGNWKIQDTTRNLFSSFQASLVVINFRYGVVPCSHCPEEWHENLYDK